MSCISDVLGPRRTEGGTLGGAPLSQLWTKMHVTFLTWPSVLLGALLNVRFKQCSSVIRQTSVRYLHPLLCTRATRVVGPQLLVVLWCLLFGRLAP